MFKHLKKFCRQTVLELLRNKLDSSGIRIRKNLLQQLTAKTTNALVNLGPNFSDLLNKTFSKRRCVKV